MPKTKISEYSATANSNTDVASINIDEGCAPSGINNAIRAVMGHLKDFQQGTNGDPFNGPVNGTVGATTPSTGAFTTLSSTGNSYFATSSGNVGIGTSSPQSRLEVRQDQSGAITRVIANNNFANTGAGSSFDYYFGTTRLGGLTHAFAASGAYLGFDVWSGSAATQRMLLDGSGNLGIGTSSPGAKLQVTDSTSAAATALMRFVGQNNYQMDVQSVTSSNSTVGSRYNFVVNSSNGEFSWSNSGGERARIDSSGNLLVGKTNTTGVNAGAVLTATGGFTLTRTGTSASDQVVFYRGTAGSEVYVGTITTTGTATSYVTSSDYRLKNTIAPMTGALAKVALLKPCTYKWNADGSNGEGFIAHELAEVVPDCVSGKKDAVNEDGSIKPQGIDTSFLVATLTAAIQEQQALITQLTARITALESA